MNSHKRLHCHRALGVLQPLAIERRPLAVGVGWAVKAGEAVGGVGVC